LSSIKSQDDVTKCLDQLKQRMDTFIKALKDGNYNEKYNQLFEVELMQITKQFESLVNYEPFQKESQNDESDSTKDNQKLVELLKTIKI